MRLHSALKLDYLINKNDHRSFYLYLVNFVYQSYIIIITITNMFLIDMKRILTNVINFLSFSFSISVPLLCLSILFNGHRTYIYIALCTHHKI